MFKPVSVDIKSDRELDVMREAGGLLAEVVELLVSRVKPGLSTGELDAAAEADIRDRKSVPAFLGYRGYPKTVCASINDEVVHGIPDDRRILKEGDIVGFDFGLVYKGLYADRALTVPVGKVSAEAERLMRVTKESLFKAIDEMTPGNRLGDVGAAVQEHAEAAGYSVVREFVGHGIGRALHEDPPVPNFGKRGTGLRLREGMVLAVEPMVNQGAAEVRVLEDRWTAVTRDGKLSAHFEHTIAIMKDGPEIFTLKSFQ